MIEIRCDHRDEWRPGRGGSLVVRIDGEAVWTPKRGQRQVLPPEELPLMTLCPRCGATFAIAQDPGEGEWFAAPHGLYVRRF